jgi:hypothetical protein
MVTELNATEAQAATKRLRALMWFSSFRRQRTLEMTKSERPDWVKVGSCLSAVSLRTAPST